MSSTMIEIEAVGLISYDGTDHSPGTVFPCESNEAKRLIALGAAKIPAATVAEVEAGLTAKELIAKIEEAATTDEVNGLVGEDEKRTTVLAAAKKRWDELAPAE